MKPIKTLLAFATIFLTTFWSASAQDSLIAQGTLDTSLSGVSVSLVVIPDSRTERPQSTTITTDSRGRFEEVFNFQTTVTAATVTASYMDCNLKRVSIVDSSYAPNAFNRIVNFRLQYCPNGGGGSNPSDTVFVKGKVDSLPRGTAVVSLSLRGSRNNPGKTANVSTNANGDYSHYFLVNKNTAQAHVTASIVDCKSNRITKVDSTSYAPPRNNTVEIDFVYCQNNSGGSNCKANFAVRQATKNRQPVPYQVVVYENSQGRNLAYLWDFGDGNTSRQKTPQHSYKGNGPYTLCLAITDSLNNCTDSLCAVVRIDSNGMAYKKEGFTIAIVRGDAPSSVEDVPNNSPLAVYPNPASESVNVQFAAKAQNQVRLSLRDLSGRTVWSHVQAVQEGETQTSIDLGHLENGIYVLQVQTTDGQWQHRIIKQ